LYSSSLTSPLARSQIAFIEFSVSSSNVFAVPVAPGFHRFMRIG
jgi:hypothetical protein